MLTLCVEQNIVKLSSMNEQPEKKNRKARSYRWTSHVSASMVLSSPTGNNQRYEQIFIGSRMMRAHVFRSSQRNRTSRAAKLECDSCAS